MIKATLILSLMLILSVQGLTFFLIGRMQHSIFWNIHSREVIENISEIKTESALLRRCEFGYLLSKLDSFKNDWNELDDSIKNHINTLRELTSDNPSQLENCNALEEIILQRLEEGQQIIESSQNVVRSQVFDDMNKLLEKMESEETSLLEIRKNTLDFYVSFVTYVNIVSTLFALSLAGLCFFFMNRNTNNLKKVIIAREKYEKELLRKEEQLRETNKELEDFAYVASHDLKAPIRAFGNLTEWLTEELGENVSDDIKKYLKLMRSRVLRMNALIDGILQYSRVGRVDKQLQNVSLNLVLNEVMELIDRKDFTINISSLPIVSANKVLMTQIFQNLVSNAIKHHPRNNGEISVTCKDKEKFWQFCVQDDGDGISKEGQNKLFQLFQTLKSRDDAENTGIGLALCKKIVTQVGGKIWVESEPDQGAKFYFTWPKT